LTAAGRREAARAAAIVEAVCEPRRVVTSPLSRAVETAEVVVERTDAEQIETDRGWKERSFGSLEGMQADAAFEDHPELHPKSAAFSARASLDGESCRTVVDRVRECWRAVRGTDEPLVVVTHETPLRIVTGLVDRTDPIEAIRRRSFTPGTTIAINGVYCSTKTGRRWIELPADGSLESL
jgi:probable phosphoglycerate mutase